MTAPPDHRDAVERVREALAYEKSLNHDWIEGPMRIEDVAALLARVAQLDERCAVVEKINAQLVDDLQACESWRDLYKSERNEARERCSADWIKAQIEAVIHAEALKSQALGQVAQLEAENERLSKGLDEDVERLQAQRDEAYAAQAKAEVEAEKLRAEVEDLERRNARQVEDYRHVDEANKRHHAALASMTAERDKYRDTLLARHGGEPLALLEELDEAREERGAAEKALLDVAREGNWTLTPEQHLLVARARERARGEGQQP